MSRSGYTDDFDDNWDLIRWRGAVASAIKGKRGQAFLRELLSVLDAMPDKFLCDEDLRHDDGSVCTLGAICVSRGLDVDKLDPYEHEELGDALGIARVLVQEIEYENDVGDDGAERWARMRRWVAAQIKPEPVAKEPTP